MTRFKSHVSTTQAAAPSHLPNGESHPCGNEYCTFSAPSIDELAKHLDTCKYAPFTAPKAKPTPSAAIEVVESATDSIPPLNGDQEPAVPITQKEPNGSSGGDDSSSSLSDPPPISNYSEIESRLAPVDYEGRKSIERLEAETRLDATVRAYLDEKSKFSYYDTAKDPKSKISAPVQELNEPETVSADLALVKTPDSDSASIPPASKVPRSSEGMNFGKYPFPEMTPVAVFEDYLTNPQAMAYEELHRRTSKVTDVMMDLQAEWDRVDKQCREHEEAEKLKSMTAAEKDKAIADEKQEEEDLVLIFLEQTYRDELKLSRKPWVDDFSTKFLEDHPDGQLTLDRLNKLRDSAFFKGFKKRQRALQENRPEQLVDRPLPDPKQTKEERDLEARKRRHLTDKITFDDMAQADAYGFTYVASDLARGNQLQVPKLRVASLPKSLKAGSRPPRNATKGSVVESAENSEAFSGEEELPTKRARAKPKKLEDDANGASSAAESSRGAASAKTYRGDDGVRRYKGTNLPSGRPPTGNKVGRPSTKKSKLDQMLLAAPMEQSSNVEGEENAGASRELSQGQVLDWDQQNQLELAAQELFEQTSPTIPKKRRGGRPKKIQPVQQDTPAFQDEMGDTPELIQKPKGKGGRKKKVVLDEQPAEDNQQAELFQLTPKPKGKGGRKKRVREEDDAGAVEDGDEPVAKKFKTEGLILTNISGTTGAVDTDGEEPLASIEQHPQSTQSSRPTTSSSKPTTTSKPPSRATSRAVGQAISQQAARGGSSLAVQAVSNAPFVAAATNTNGKRAYDSVYDGPYGAGFNAGTMSYNGYTENGIPGSKRAKITDGLLTLKINGTFNEMINNGVPMGADDMSQTPKVRKKKAASTKRKRADGEDGLTGGNNTADVTNNNSGAEDGGTDSKRSKKSREKTAEEKASQSAAMKHKWADPNGKMRQGIERRKRRDQRKAWEKNRVEKFGGAPATGELCYKSDDDGFDAGYWPSHIVTPPVPIITAPPPGSLPAQTTGQPTPATEEQAEIPFRDENEDEEAEFAVESPQAHRPKPIITNALALTTTRSGRQSKPSRKVNHMELDGADEYSDVEDDRPALLSQRSESAYDEFQKLTSPGHQLGKRVSKPLFKMNYGTTSEEEEEEEEF